MDEVTLFEEREIEIHFDTGAYRLIPGCTGTLGEPLENFLDLYGVSPDAVVRISTPEDLARITRAVRSPAEALEFVRVFTSPRTHYLFERRRVLIDLTESDAAMRGFGVIDRALSQRLSLPAAHVVEGTGVFDVERCLVTADSPAAPRTVLLRNERVFRDGKYERVGERPIATLDADDVTLPFYE